ncbi:REP-associated tyrosine transposase [Crassaminicella profunda]|uniref:REP-associated tyrosine transposase n=1 Tax=Crassaminicella profunda TaxID=1286698 RepID=UPI001CA75D40|nr:transposase [Crassaminicella profunda]QZY55562.1 transposase [Crassaminicella profunda]
MGRKPRVECEGGVYHVIQRGNNKEYIFRKKEEKTYLLNMIEEYRDRMGFEIYAFVFMDNHYHVVMKTLKEPLHKIMHRINNRYSKYYNYKNGRTGHVFENRYKGILVKDDRYLLSLIRYVHQNPVRAKMCKRVKDYEWSSDLYYRNHTQNEIVDIDFVLDIFSENRKEAIKLYESFMDMEEKEERSFFEEGLSIGENQIKAKIMEPKSKDRKNLDEILYAVTQDKGIYEEIKKGSRKRKLSIYKKEYIQRSLAFNYKMKEIGENISISEAAVFKINNR